MPLWTDETSMPAMLLQLLEIPNIPEDLQKELLQVKKEIEERGAVTYPTKARVEYYLYHHRNYLSELLNMD